MSGPDRRPEARRALAICNICGYCNGLCDLFTAARRRPALSATDLAHLANLCHGCRGCLYACQYAPPHPFAVNLPRCLAEVRQQGYAEGVWPRAWQGLLAHGWAVLLLGIAAMLLMLVLVYWVVPAEVLFATHRGAGAFYRIVPWRAMLLIGLLPLAWSLLALTIGLRRYWREQRGTSALAALPLAQALRDALTLRNLKGGGPGCADLDERPAGARRRLHQTLVLGLGLCLAATLIATYYHHALAWEAPYPLVSLPVIFGTLGGGAMLIGTLGLIWLKWHGDPTPTTPAARAAEYALLILLLLVALSGLTLLAARATPAMGLLLALHLGAVLGLFLMIPYSKLVHAGYRLLALVIEAHASRQGQAPEPEQAPEQMQTQDRSRG